MAYNLFERAKKKHAVTPNGSTTALNLLYSILGSFGVHIPVVRTG